MAGFFGLGKEGLEVMDLVGRGGGRGGGGGVGGGRFSCRAEG